MTAWIQELLARQRSDGGWAYGARGSSWTEPTCYAVLALLSSPGSSTDSAVDRGIGWLARLQNPDGGWRPRDGVEESTWVTALALLLPAGELRFDRSGAAAWLMAQTGRESGFWQRLRLQLLGVDAGPGQEFDGWPWYPGAAAWVIPTALSILAMQKLRTNLEPDPERNREMEERIEQGRSYLLARRCRDGGWNHGSTRALGYDSDSYPETTGTALLALHDTEAAQLGNAIEVAENHLETSPSLEAVSWLTLALVARGRRPRFPQRPSHGGTNEIALAALAEAALEGRNVFVG